VSNVGYHLKMDGARHDFLYICQQLGIPAEIIKAKIYPLFAAHPNAQLIDETVLRPESFPFPPWDLLRKTEQEYKQEAVRYFEAYLDVVVAGGKDRMLAKGWVFPKTHRNKKLPIDVKYAWAAHRLCYGTPFKEIAVVPFSQKWLRLGDTASDVMARTDTVQKAVKAVFEELSISE